MKDSQKKDRRKIEVNPEGKCLILREERVFIDGGT